MMRRGPSLRLGVRGTLAAAALVAALVAMKPFVRINATPSMPVGLYAVGLRPAALRRGAVVVVCLPEAAAALARARDYIGHGECPGDFEALLKPVSAVAGDLVVLSERGATVNGVPVANSAPLARDSAGRPMTSTPFGTYAVTPGAFWTISNHDRRSFDSRYFGPVSIANVRGLALPVLVSP